MTGDPAAPAPASAAEQVATRSPKGRWQAGGRISGPGFGTGDSFNRCR